MQPCRIACTRTDMWNHPPINTSVHTQACVCACIQVCTHVCTCSISMPGSVAMRLGQQMPTANSAGADGTLTLQELHWTISVPNRSAGLHWQHKAKRIKKIMHRTLQPPRGRLLLRHLALRNRPSSRAHRTQLLQRPLVLGVCVASVVVMQQLTSTKEST